MTDLLDHDIYIYFEEKKVASFVFNQKKKIACAFITIDMTKQKTRILQPSHKVQN